MSTRATIHFLQKGEETPTAIVYRHSDGGPKGLGKRLHSFIEILERDVADMRFDDAGTLAARWVVYDMYGNALMQHLRTVENPDRINVFCDSLENLLGAPGVAIVGKDPPNIDYRYFVICSEKAAPVIHWELA
jgi:hypothetical protein